MKIRRKKNVSNRKRKKWREMVNRVTATRAQTRHYFAAFSAIFTRLFDISWIPYNTSVISTCIILPFIHKK